MLAVALPWLLVTSPVPCQCDSVLGVQSLPVSLPVSLPAQRTERGCFGCCSATAAHFWFFYVASSTEFR